MDSGSLQATSKYLNNLLLSHGLLRHSQPVDFALSSKEPQKTAENAVAIINLVHDLVIRRGRDQDRIAQASELCLSLKNAAAAGNQNTARLESKVSDVERQLGTAISQERATRDALKEAVAKNRDLREDLAKSKASVTQLRAQCLKDVRRKETELSRMKKLLEGRRGREGTVMGVTVLNTSKSSKQMDSGSSSSLIAADSHISPNYPDNSNSITQLAKNLAEENDALHHLVQQSIASLKTVQGLSIEGTVESLSHSDQPGIENTPIMTVESSAAQMESLLESITEILTNPAFVPLDEMLAKEQEIQRLREGWETMESKWKDAVRLMVSWQKRIAQTGHTVSLDDLRTGIQLGTQAIPTNLDELPDLEPQSPVLQAEDDGYSESPDGHLSAMKRRLEEPPVRFSPRKRPADLDPYTFAYGAGLSDDETSRSQRSPKRAKLDTRNDGTGQPSTLLQSPKRRASPRKSIQEKLRQVAAEAESARLEEPIRDSRDEYGLDSLDNKENLPVHSEQVGQSTKTAAVAPHKRTTIPRLKGRTKRRSTLSPQELGELINGNVQLEA